MTEPIQSDELIWLGIDFDQVTSNSSPLPPYTIGEPVEGAVEALQELHRRGWKLVIFTARHWADVRPIEDWCQSHGIPIKAIICGKPLFRWQIDDRAIEFDPQTPKESWKRAVDKIGFRPQ